jgi:hypothetical protein
LMALAHLEVSEIELMRQDIKWNSKVELRWTMEWSTI